MISGYFKITQSVSVAESVVVYNRENTDYMIWMSDSGHLMEMMHLIFFCIKWKTRGEI